MSEIYESRNETFSSRELVAIDELLPVTDEAISLNDSSSANESSNALFMDSGFDDDINSINSDTTNVLSSNWADKLLASRSCKEAWSSLTCISPTMKHVVAHLELLYDITTEWNHSVTPLSNNALIMSQCHTPSVTMTSSKELSVSGVSFSNTGIEDLNKDLPLIGADEVIDEVLILIARLEKERISSRLALNNERKLGIELENKVDSLSRKRMIKLPIAVQKEHEACSLNISELKWHVSYKKRYASKFDERVKTAQNISKKLENDISFVKKHVPLVSEKLDLEKKAMERIKRAQEDTTDELGCTVERCKSVTSKHDDAHVKADGERSLIKQGLNVVTEELSTVINELTCEKDAHLSLEGKKDVYMKKYQQCNDNLNQLQVHEDNCKATENMQSSIVEELFLQISKKESIRRKLVTVNNKIFKERDSKNKEFSDYIRDLRASMDEKEDRLKRTIISNREIEMDTADCFDMIEKRKVQMSSDERNIERIYKEQRRTGSQLDSTRNELNAKRKAFQTASDSLRDEEQRCLSIEQKLKGLLETLTAQLKEEIENRTSIAMSMKTQSNDYVTTENELRAQSAKTNRKSREVEKAVRQVTAKVEKLRSTYAEITKAIKRIQKELLEIDKDEKELICLTDNEIKELTPLIQLKKEEIVELNRQLLSMSTKVDAMCTQMNEMATSSLMINRGIHASENSIRDMQHELNEISIQSEDKLRISDCVKLNLKKVKDRIYDTDKAHKEHMEVRMQVKEDHRTKLNNLLEENKHLASDYRILQNNFLSKKDEYFTKYDSKIGLESSLADLKKLNSLQEKMHVAIGLYFKYRGLYNVNKLHTMKIQAQFNNSQVIKLQHSMDFQLATIADFLTNQMVQIKIISSIKAS